MTQAILHRALSHDGTFKGRDGVAVQLSCRWDLPMQTGINVLDLRIVNPIATLQMPTFGFSRRESVKHTLSKSREGQFAPYEAISPCLHSSLSSVHRPPWGLSAQSSSVQSANRSHWLRTGTFTRRSAQSLRSPHSSEFVAP